MILVIAVSPTNTSLWNRFLIANSTPYYEQAHIVKQQDSPAKVARPEVNELPIYRRALAKTTHFDAIGAISLALGGLGVKNAANAGRSVALELGSAAGVAGALQVLKAIGQNRISTAKNNTQVSSDTTPPNNPSSPNANSATTSTETNDSAVSAHTEEPIRLRKTG